MPWLIEWIIRKQLFGLLFRFPGPPVSGPSPLSGFPRISKDFQGVARMDHTSRSPQPIYCWCLRLPSDSFQILIRSLSDPHQIPFRSPSDSYHIPFRFPHLQGSSPNLILVLKLPLLLWELWCKGISHLCSAHQDL